MDVFMINFKEPIFYGRLLKRYKRFFMDVLLDMGEIVTAYIPNTGSMMGLLTPYNRVLLTKNLDPNKRLKFCVQAIEIQNSWVGVNTHLPNKLIKNSLYDPLLLDLKTYQDVKSEVFYGKDLRSRVDLHFLNGLNNEPPLFCEIKNVTLKIGSHAQFPDAVSKRALKHLEDLLYAQKHGFKALLIFLVQRQDCHFFSAAKEIDKTYADALANAFAKGLKIKILCARIDESGLRLTHSLPGTFL
jgi:sugar fermentation stimulation protein A